MGSPFSSLVSAFKGHRELEIYFGRGCAFENCVLMREATRNIIPAIANKYVMWSDYEVAKHDCKQQL